MISPGKGTLLIANPFLKDPNFIRTVVFLCEHQEEGTFGFVLNKICPQTLDELLTDMEVKDIPTFFGGPVQQNSVHFLHQYPQLIPGGEEVLKNTYWGGNFESLLINIKMKNIDLSRIKFFLGYSGWGAGQLDSEMIEKTWLTVEANESLIFSTPPEDIWKSSLKTLGGEYEMMINFPLDPQLN